MGMLEALNEFVTRMYEATGRYPELDVILQDREYECLQKDLALGPSVVHMLSGPLTGLEVRIQFAFGAVRVVCM